jgi:hypothetical protein
MHHPYGTQRVKSFCATSTGVGWRQIIENMHKNAMRAEVVQEPRQTQEIYAKAKTSTSRLSTLAGHRRRRRSPRPPPRHDIPLTAAEENRAP